MQRSIKLNPHVWEEIEILLEKSFGDELIQAKKFVDGGRFELEVDLDSIVGIPSDVMTSTGFSAAQCR